MQRGEFDEQALAWFEQVHFDFSSVPLARAPLNQPTLLAPRDERHHAMGLRLKALGEFADIGVFASGKSLDVEKHQILQWRNAV
jgi:hypothetical protein